MKKALRVDWDVIAGIAAAVLAIILHLLHIVHTEVLLTIALVLLALLLFRDLRREGHDEHAAEALARVDSSLRHIDSSLEHPESVLIGPRQLRAETRRFVEAARGEMIWFNVCFSMFKRAEIFDQLLRPAIENPKVDSIVFVAAEGERGLWAENMLPKMERCAGKAKIKPPRWCDLPETVSFILADMEHGKTEALLSFWGEPFMARSIERPLPRYVFRVHGHSDLVAQFVEIDRRYRMESS